MEHPDLIEYALVACLVGLGAVAAMKGLSNEIAAPLAAPLLAKAVTPTIDAQPRSNFGAGIDMADAVLAHRDKAGICKGVSGTTYAVGVVWHPCLYFEVNCTNSFDAKGTQVSTCTLDGKQFIFKFEK